MFTERFLAGSSLYPDARYVPSYLENEQYTRKSGTMLINRTTVADWIPVVSLVSGSCKILAGLVHSVCHLAQAIFDQLNRSAHLQSASLGLKNIIRGLVALVPFLGNLAIYLFDCNRFENEGPSRVVKGFTVLFEGGREVARKPSAQYYQKSDETDLSAEEVIQFLRGGQLDPMNDRPFGGICLIDCGGYIYPKSLEVDRQLMAAN